MWKHLAHCPHTTQFKRDLAASEQAALRQKRSCTSARNGIEENAPSAFLSRPQQPVRDLSAHSSLALMSSPSWSSPLQASPRANRIVRYSNEELGVMPRLRFENTRSIPSSQPALEAATIPGWSAMTLEQFRQDLCRLFIVCNVPWAAVAHPYWLWFFATYMPTAQMPSPQQLSGRVLDTVAGKVLGPWRTRTQDKHGCGQSDGWKNVRRRSLIASIMNVEYKVS
jgi:hypothetical protein